MEPGMWALWIVGGLIAWVVVAIAVGIVIGRGVRLADRQAAAGRDALAVAAAAEPAAARQRVVARAPRRVLPLPPAGVALAAVAVLLETSGYALRLSHSQGALRRLLSMDAPLSLPRLFVAALFAAAAAAALIGAGSLPGRRAWWTGVGVVAGLIAAVKAGGTIHSTAKVALSNAIGFGGAVVVSVLLAAGVVGTLFWLSRAERRDRRRVLGTLALYAFASVGLSAISDFVSTHGAGFALDAAATYVEESGEALAGVAFLVAVLVGVAPRLVLPASWPLRREADNFTLDASEALPGLTAASAFDTRR